MEDNVTQCRHSWEEVERTKQVKTSMQATFFRDGFVQYEWSILQKCSKCGMEDVIRY